MTQTTTYSTCLQRFLTVALMLWLCLGAQSQVNVTSNDSVKVTPIHHVRQQVTLEEDTINLTHKPVYVVNASGDTVAFASIDSIKGIDNVEVVMDSTASPTLGKMRIFNPDPKRAMWMSVLCPGLGQIYNRRYWKLPIVVGAFVGLSYGATWNNRMYKDYSKAYRDVMDDDPDTRSYMDFFPPTVTESDLDKAWLQKVMKSKRDYYRRYREICVIAMVGVYLINIVDAYVDASLAHFDISPDLSLDVAPTAIDNGITGSRLPSLGLQCAISF